MPINTGGKIISVFSRTQKHIPDYVLFADIKTINVQSFGMEEYAAHTEDANLYSNKYSC
jgi:hypothetical protein